MIINNNIPLGDIKEYKMSSGKLKKAQYYVWYFGWKECKGLAGREFTEPIVRELLQRRSHEELPKLTIEVSKKDLKVVQLVEKKKGKIEKVKYPSIPSRDITFAIQALVPDDDVVACIYLGYNPSTKCVVHVHVYRCDSPDTAAILVNQLDLVIQIPDHQLRIRKIEEELSRKGQIALRPASRLEGYLHYNLPPQANQYEYNDQSYSNGNMYRRSAEQIDDGADFTVGSGSYSSESDPHSPRSPDEISYHNSSRHHSSNGSEKADVRRRNEEQIPDEEQVQGFESLAAELKSKLGREPLLLPPKDYDTIHRKRGNAFDFENRKCLNKEIVGNLGMYETSNNNNQSKENENNSYLPQSVPNQGNSKRGSSNSFGRNSIDDEVEEMSAMSLRGYQKKGLRRLSSDDTNSSNPDDPFTPPGRPFSPGPFTQELQNSYFPQKGPELPNYLRKSRGSHNSLNHSRQSSGDQSAEDPLMQSGNKYTASHLGIAQKKKLMNQQSSPEFGRLGHGPGFRRQRSNDEGYTSMDKHEINSDNSGSNTFKSDPDIDLAASMPAMKFKEHRKKTPKEAARVYVDDGDPGAFVPIDYTVAVRKKERKAIP